MSQAKMIVFKSFDPAFQISKNIRQDWRLLYHKLLILHFELKKGTTLSMAITLSVLGRFAEFFHCCKEH